MEQDDNVTEKLNKLLIKCIEFRKQLIFENPQCLQQIQSKEESLRNSLLTRYKHLLNTVNQSLIEIDLYVERTSKQCQKPTLFLCDPNWSIYTTQLKVKDHINEDVPIEHILVICESKIAKGWNTLRQCGVINNGDMLYVYIVENQDEEKHPESKTDVTYEARKVSLSNSDTDDFEKLLKHFSFSTSVSDLNEGVSFLPALLSQPEPELSVAFNGANITSIDDANNPNISSQDVIFPSPHEASIPLTHTNKYISMENSGTTNAKLVQTASLLVENTDQSVPNNVDSFQFVAQGWQCNRCTFVNEPTRPGCQMCSNPRPADYKQPVGYMPSPSEQERLKQEKYNEGMVLKLQQEANSNAEADRERNYQGYVQALEQHISENLETVDCSICFTEASPGEAIILAECLHIFCKDCLSMHITLSDQVPVKCPFVDDDYDCESVILEREIRCLLSEDKFQDYLKKGLNAAEMQSSNSFHCKTANCHGWCEYDDGVNVFECPVCNHKNCLTCKAIHEDMDCREYQQQLLEKPTNKQAKKTKKLLKKLVKKKQAMHCPCCNIIILKKEGCDWLRCSMCSLEICWVTQQARWGPAGHGDTSGGCHCRENNKKCDPRCINCH